MSKETGNGRKASTTETRRIVDDALTRMYGAMSKQVAPLPEWMIDPSKLPKRPPNKSNDS